LAVLPDFVTRRQGKIAQPGERNGTLVKNRIENATMRTVAAIFVVALIHRLRDIYSDATLTSAEVSHTAAPVPATVAMSHGLKHG
jgi:hypothetical protein